MTGSPRVYIAGPLESVGGNFNFPLFDHVAAKLRQQGCTVFNPADHAREKLGPLEKIQKLDKKEMRAARRMLMADELIWICTNADFMVMLPGWQNSLGATAERSLAIALDISIRELPNLIPELEPDFLDFSLQKDVISSP